MPALPWWAASLVANVTIIAVEYLNRTQPDLWSALVRTWPLILVAQVCIFWAWNGAPSLLLAWAVFFVGSSLARLVMVTGVLGESYQAGWVLLGITLLGLGSLAIKQGVQL